MNANFLVEKIEIFLSYLIISQQDTTIQMDKGNEISFWFHSVPFFQISMKNLPRPNHFPTRYKPWNETSLNFILD